MSNESTNERRSLGSDAPARAALLIRESPPAATALLAAALLPPDAVPWPWLRDVTNARHVEVSTNPLLWDELRDRLVAQRILVPGFAPEVARMHAQVAAEVAGTLSASDTLGLGAAIRDLVAQRLQRFTSERQRLFQEVVRGNAGPEAAGWYVAPLAEVKARADTMGSVEVTALVDGSFVLSLKQGAFWEEPCLKAFIDQQFASDVLEAIEWALRSGQLTNPELENSRDRIQAIHARRPDGVQEAKVMGLFLLNVARIYCTSGMDRSAWLTAGEAVELFRQLHECHPAAPDVAALLEDAKQAQWRYNW